MALAGAAGAQSHHPLQGEAPSYSLKPTGFKLAGTTKSSQTLGSGKVFQALSFLLVVVILSSLAGYI